MHSKWCTALRKLIEIQTNFIGQDIIVNNDVACVIIHNKISSYDRTPFRVCRVNTQDTISRFLNFGGNGLGPACIIANYKLQIAL